MGNANPGMCDIRYVSSTFVVESIGCGKSKTIFAITIEYSLAIEVTRVVFPGFGCELYSNCSLCWEVRYC